MNGLTLVSVLINNESYDTIVGKCKDEEDFRKRVKAYIHHNSNSIDKVIPLLKVDFKLMQPLFPSWIVFEAYRRGVVDKDALGSVLITDDAWQDPILYNYPEVIEKRPYLKREYESSTKDLDNIIQYRHLPYHDDEALNAITRDDIEALKACFAGPEFECSGSELKVAVKYDAKECFRFLLLNDGDVESAMFEAVECGRREMIELLEQSGATYAKAVNAAVRGYQPDILEWLLDTERCSQEEIKRALSIAFWDKMKDSIDIILSHCDFPVDNAMACDAMGIRNDLVEEFMTKEKMPYSDSFYTAVAQDGPVSILKKCLGAECTKEQAEWMLNGAMQRVPFEKGIAQLITRKLPEIPHVEFGEIKSPEAFLWLLDRGVRFTSMEGALGFDICDGITRKLIDPYGVYFSYNPMFWEAHELEQFERLAEFGVDLSYPNRFGETILFYYAGHKDIADFLISKGCSLDTPNCYGDTPRDKYK